MATRENNPPPGSGPAMPAVPVRRSALLGPQEAAWAGVPDFAAPPEPEASGLSPSAYLHGLRRHLVSATCLGLLCAVLAGAAVHWGWAPQYQAVAQFKIETSEPKIIYATGASGERFIQSAFDIFKEDQAMLVKSNQVITRTLDPENPENPEVANLGILDRNFIETILDIDKDKIKWVQDHLQVSFPMKSSIMQVSLTCADEEKGKQVAALVNAVADTYKNEIVEKEKKGKRDRLDRLDKLHAGKRQEVYSQADNLRKLASDVGTADPEALRLRQQMAMRVFGDIQGQYSQAWVLLERTRGELKGQQTMLSNVNTVRIPLMDMDALTDSRPAMRQLTDELTRRMMARDNTMANVRPGSGGRWIRDRENDVQSLEAEIKALGGDAEQKIREKMRLDIEAEILELETRVEVLAGQEQQLGKKIKQQEDEIKKLSSSSIDLEMERKKIDRADTVLANIDEQRAKLQVELGANPQVRLLQPAFPPRSQSKRGIRIALTILATIAGLCLPIACITWWDTRGHRVNSPNDVSQGLGLTVLGSVPTIPARAVRQLGSSSSKRHQTWHLRLTESIDGIAARLLRQAEVNQTRVILISSATSGEGKTTLATQLAMSLARNGRRTVLVDFDLRRPAFDKVLGLPLEPGISEVLRGQSDASEAVHETGTHNLHVVTAGRWDRSALSALANGGAGRLFDALREEYEFVIVDAAPILPVADTRFVSQHVDSVVLSVFRDISRTPKIAAACEILEAFGVGCVEAVVTGPTEHLPDKDLKYEAISPAVPTTREATSSAVTSVGSEEISNDGQDEAV